MAEEKADTDKEIREKGEGINTGTRTSELTDVDVHANLS
jgi:hypothetical protein